MRYTKILLIAPVLLQAMPAAAQDLTTAEVVALIKGNTHYAETLGGPRGKGPLVLYYSDDNKLFAKFPNGPAKGTYTFKDNASCPKWDDQPTVSCTRYRKEGDKVIQINIENGQPRGHISKTVPGNPEKF
jgi:hypothetical protein